MHAEAVVFDFMQPLVAVRRRFDELRQLRPYPVRQSRLARVRAGRYRLRHAGSGKGFVRRGMGLVYASLGRGGPLSP